MAQEINIYIDKIVLDGMHDIHGPSFVAAVEAQLALLISERTQPFPDASTQYQHRLNGGQVQLDVNSGATEMGQSVAHNIYNSILPTYSTP